MKIIENSEMKIVSSEDYNYDFHKETGYFERWGKTKEDDPLYAPGPELADIEVTTICKGAGGKLCKHCYKSNTPNGSNMSLDTFKKVFDKMTSENNVLTQIAFGADANATANPDLFDMMWYCRNNGIIPNITVADIDQEIASKLAEVCGAVAVSRYENKDICYNSVKLLNDYGLDQVNIHLMVSEETFETCLETLEDKLNDDRLEGLKAIVFLSLKQKGRGENFTPLSFDKFKILVLKSIQNNINIGFDSCSAYKFLKSIKGYKYFDKMYQYVEPCESTLFSIYVNYRGEAFPCSFSEDNGEWKKGIDIVSAESFTRDIWLNSRIVNFRNKLIENIDNSKKRFGNKYPCRKCPIFRI